MKGLCDGCGFTVWAPHEQALLQMLTEHSLTHYEDYAWGSDAGVAWTCPHCSVTSKTTTMDQATTELRAHLQEQHADRFTVYPTHITEEIDHSGSLLIDAHPDQAHVDTVRAYVRSAATAAIVVTSQPSKQIEQLHTSETDLPDAISVITTQSQPDQEAKVNRVPVNVLYRSSVGIEVIEAGSLSALGISISDSTDNLRTVHTDVCVDVGILDEMLGTFGVEAVFKFLVTLDKFAKQKDAFVSYLLDFESVQVGDLMSLRRVFDLVVTARGRGLVLEE